MACRWGLVAFGAAVCALPSVAHAGNGLHPRTPVIWEDVPCLTVVDRSADPVLSFEYTIPFEDTDVGEDEVADSRTHQFLAFCRDKDPQTVLPNWVSWDDVNAAGMLPLDVDPAEVSDDQVLDTSSAWADCWARITADADRRPITDANAAMPVVWDTTGLTAGPWIIYGYTYEPAFNIYKRRPGIVQIVDDPAPEATGPALAITTTEQILYKGGETTFEGCISAMDGSTIDAYWSIADESADWVPFLEDEPVMGESLSIPFMAPEEITGKTSMIRMDIKDPMGRTYTSYMTELVMVLQQENPEDCDEGGGAFVSNPGCGGMDESGSGDTSDDLGDTGDETGTAEGDGTGSGPSTVGADGDDDGGKCSVGAQRSVPLFLFGLFALGLGRRRRR